MQSNQDVVDMRILVVEDMGMIAREVELMLKRLGCEVVGPVATLEDGIEAARHELIDGAILDVNLHGEDSYPIADELIMREIGFIFTTGYGTLSLEQDFRRFPVLTKPFSQQELHAKMVHAFVNKVFP